ncbi:MAG: calcineurin-like phosphoesterase C-terminal domain-containing protein, partial [Tannerella sp.]|nr:calcineurin-like phosphoesterase C-terminal domain-containing protein [Tannerella sp.]
MKRNQSKTAAGSLAAGNAGMRRRNVFRTTGSVFVLVLCTGFFRATAMPPVRGCVYEDVNHNGKRERREKGIANVAVSNGREVVLTDSDGRYALPAGDDHIIFAVKPSGYVFETDEYNQPESFYIHKPGGSPPLTYQGVKPTGDMPASLDFALTKHEEEETFTSFIFGDSQPYTEEEVRYFEKGIVDEASAATAGVSFGITLGDLVGDNLTLHPLYKEAIKKTGLPWYHVMGNHDMNVDAKADSLSDETFEANFGPANYAFNYGRAHFIVLDDILYPDPVDGRGYRGGFRKDQLTFVENDLRFVPDGHLIVICMHIPLMSDNDAFVEDDRRELFRLLARYPDVLVMSAHTHYQEHHFAGRENGLDRDRPLHEYNVGATCGDWYSGIHDDRGIPLACMRDGTPKGYALLTVTGNRYTLDYKVAGKPADYNINLYCPRVVPQGRYAPVIYANYFMGDEGSVLEYRVDRGEWKKMNRVEDYDPAYYHYMQEWDYAEEVRPGRRPSNPVRSMHLWRAAISPDQPAGKYEVEVRTAGRNGKEYVASGRYEIRER